MTIFHNKLWISSLFSRINSLAQRFGAIDKLTSTLKDLFTVRKNVGVAGEELKAFETFYDALDHSSIHDATSHRHHGLYPPVVVAPPSIAVVHAITESAQPAVPYDVAATRNDAISTIPFPRIRSKGSNRTSSNRWRSSVTSHKITAGEGVHSRNEVSPVWWSTSGFTMQGLSSAITDAPRVLDARDMNVIRFLGEGTMGKVYFVQDRVSEAKVALKVIPKEGRSKSDLVVLMEERDISEKLSNSPWFVKLYASWHDHEFLYIAMTAYPTDLDSELLKHNKLNPARARFYMAELIIALTELHCRGIIHRDVKAANILIDREGHIVLADFGLSKDFHKIPSTPERMWQPFWPYLPNDHPNSETPPREAEEVYFVVWDYHGSELEMAPEVHLRKPHAFGIDFWSAAVVLYWMVTGRPPWYYDEDRGSSGAESDDVKPLATKIIEDDIYWDPGDNVDDVTKDFLERMLRKDPRKRLVISYEIPAHAYFSGVNWNLMEERQIPAPWIPDMEIYHEYEPTSPTFIPAEPYLADEYDPHPEFTYLSNEATAS